MKKRFLSLILLCVVLSSNALALYEEKIFDGWVDSGKRFTIAGENYTATYMRQGNITVITFPGNFGTVITNGSCVEDWIYKACVSQKKFLLNGKEVPFNTHASNLDISLKMQIFASYAKIEHEKRIDSLSLIVGEEVPVELDVRNTGKLESSRVIVTDRYGSAFSLRQVAGACKVQGSSMVLDTSLRPNEYMGCKYMVKAVSPVEKYPVNLSINFTFLRKSKVVSEVKKMDIVSAVARIDRSADKVKTKPSDNVTLWLNLTALSDLRVSLFTVVLPDSATLVDSTQGMYYKTTNSMKWSGHMDKGESKFLFFNIESKLVKNMSINYSLTYDYNDLQKEIKGTIPFESTLDVFYIGTVNSSGQKLRIANPSTNSFKDVKVTVVFDGREETIRLDSLGARRFREYDIPNITQATEVRAEFKTVYGQPLSFRNALTPVKITDVFANLTKETAPVEKEPEAKAPETVQEFKDEKKGIGISLDFLKNIDLVLFRNITVVFVSLVVVSAILSKVIKKRHGIDHEIDELKKQIKEETGPPEPKDQP